MSCRGAQFNTGDASTQPGGGAERTQIQIPSVNAAFVGQGIGQIVHVIRGVALDPREVQSANVGAEQVKQETEDVSVRAGIGAEGSIKEAE